MLYRRTTNGRPYDDNVLHFAFCILRSDCTPSLIRLFASQKSTFPFAVPGVRLGDGAPALHTDRGTRCAFPPPATGGGQARDPPGEGFVSPIFLTKQFRGHFL